MSTSSPAPDVFKVYKPSSGSSSLLANLPDVDLTPTAADIKAAQATLTARTQALVNAPLQLRAAREAEIKAKRDRWPETLIRIKFMDGTQLERSFPSTNKIRSVYAFVRGCLREDVQPIKFILYQPPKRDLKVSDPTVRDLTLAELQLAPSSILLLRFEDDQLNHAAVSAPLATTILSQAVELPRPKPVESVEPAGAKPSSNTTPTSSKSEPSKKIPKWLKIGQKK